MNLPTIKYYNHLPTILSLVSSFKYAAMSPITHRMWQQVVTVTSFELRAKINLKNHLGNTGFSAENKTWGQCKCCKQILCVPLTWPCCPRHPGSCHREVQGTKPQLWRAAARPRRRDLPQCVRSSRWWTLVWTYSVWTRWWRPCWNIDWRPGAKNNISNSSGEVIMLQAI